MKQLTQMFLESESQTLNRAFLGRDTDPFS